MENPVRKKQKRFTARAQVSLLFAFIMLLSSLPATAWALPEQYGIDELSRHVDQDLGHPEYQTVIDSNLRGSQDLTLEETRRWKAGFESQAIVDNAAQENRSLTEGEISRLYGLSLLQLGASSDEDIINTAERAKREKYPDPVQQVLSNDRILAAMQDGYQDEEASISYRNSSEGIAAVEGADIGGGASQSQRGSWASIGVYPRTKGKLLVTADPFSPMATLGHAAIVYGAGSPGTVVESLLGGVILGTNNWDNYMDTCYGLNVLGTNQTQQNAAADWCYSKRGCDYNPNYLDIYNNSKFYCSQLIWRGYKDLTGINLNTPVWDPAIHPFELINTPNTAILYRHGLFGADSWEYINGQMYYVSLDGTPKSGGWRWVASSSDWFYFAPTGELSDVAQVSIAASSNTTYRIDIPSASNASGVQAQIWQYYGNQNQRWNVFTYDYNYYYIQCRSSEKYLMVANSSVYNGAPVIQNTYTSVNAMKWYLYLNNNNTYSFASAQNSNYYLDLVGNNTSNGTQIDVYTNNGTNAQKWYFLDWW